MQIGRIPALGVARGHAFRQRVERHIDDVERGEGRRSLDVAFELEGRHTETSDFLANNHPEALSQYLGLLSGLDYGQRARIATSMNQFSRGLRAFEEMHAQKQYAAQEKA